MSAISRAATTRMARVARAYEDLKVQRVRRCSVWGTMAVRGRTSVLRCAAEEWRPNRMIIRQCSNMRFDQVFLNWKREVLGVDLWEVHAGLGQLYWYTRVRVRSGWGEHASLSRLVPTSTCLQAPFLLLHSPLGRVPRFTMEGGR
jgi:hypothetical protein